MPAPTVGRGNLPKRLRRQLQKFISEEPECAWSAAIRIHAPSLRPLRYHDVSFDCGGRRAMNGSFIGTFRIMKRSAMYLSAVSLLFSSAAVIGQTNGAKSSAVALSQLPNDSTPQGSPQDQRLVADILSDTQGADFGPYMRQALQSIRRLWLSSESVKATPADKSQTETIIRFTISPEGKISAMQLVQSAHQIEIDRAAWGSITAVGEFPPLPTEFNSAQPRPPYRLQSEPFAAVDRSLLAAPAKRDSR